MSYTDPYEYTDRAYFAYLDEGDWDGTLEAVGASYDYEAACLLVREFTLDEQEMIGAIEDFTTHVAEQYMARKRDTPETDLDELREWLESEFPPIPAAPGPLLDLGTFAARVCGQPAANECGVAA